MKPTATPRVEAITEWLKRQVGERLGISAADIAGDVPLTEYGLGSIEALSLAGDLEAWLGRRIDPAIAWDFPTVAELASALGEESTATDTATAPAALSLVADPARRHEPFALAELQQAYWIGRSHALEMGNVSCHCYEEFDGTLDVSRLEEAWNRVVARHDMLRAVILPDGRQRVLSTVPRYGIDVEDLSTLSDADTQRRLVEKRNEMSHAVFDTAQWPLFALRATRLAHSTRLHVSLDLLIADLFSIQLVLSEWHAFYKNPDLELPPLELSFRDCVLAETAVRAGDSYRASLEYWRRRLDDIPAGPDLPLARDPSTVEHPRFVRRAFSLDAPSWQRVRARGGAGGLTPSAILLAAFADVLATWSTASRFTLNLTIFMRRAVHPEMDKVVGDFTSVSPVVVNARPDVSFRERAQRIQRELVEVLEHRDVSGIEVMRELARRRGSGAPRAFPVVFTSSIARQAEGLGARWLGAQGFGVSQTPQTWLDHQVFEDEGTLRIHWDAVESLFPAGLLDDMFAAYQRMLRGLADDERAWDRVEPGLLPDAQRAQRDAINNTHAPIPSQLLHQLVEERARIQPDRTAVVAHDGTLSYRALDAAANRLAHRLRALRVMPNTLVGVVMDKGYGQVIAVLGILKAGAAYLPVDPGLPHARLHHILEASDVTVALIESGAAVTLPERILAIAVDDRVCADEDNGPLDPIQGPQDLAYVIYTSGSTGVPKGVMIDHRGAVNTVVDVNTRFEIRDSDRVLGLSSLSFDLSVYDIFGTLGVGGTLLLPPPGAVRDPDQLVRWVADTTVWNSVPALMQMAVEHVEAHRSAFSRDLRVVMLSGDFIPPRLPARVRALAPSAQVYSLGGATEASIWSICHPAHALAPNATSVPYGRPMVNQQFFVLDDALEHRPDWVPGELFIGGIGLAQGYWRDAEKTASRFIVHPRTGARLYRTGDLGRFLPDGNIDILGRIDHQVKVNGFRVELGEIEAALAEHPGLSAAVATVHGDRHGPKRLVAYVVPRDSSAPSLTDAELARFLAARLPSSMVPHLFVRLAELPISANGKFDRKALPEPRAATVEPGITAAGADDALSQLVAHTLADLIGAPVDLDRNFFDVGGSSLLAVRLAARLSELIQAPVPVASVFQAPTMRHIAEEIRTMRKEAHVNVEADATLDPSILPAPQQVHPAPQVHDAQRGQHGPSDHATFPSDVLVTGATGLLGVHLVAELLRQTNARIHCLVRAPEGADALEALRKAMGFVGRWRPEHAQRIVPVRGDVAASKLGMGAEAYARLSDQIGAIFHSAAAANVVAPYATVKPVNVNGTVEAIRFACAGQPKALHFVSTAGVYLAGDGGSNLGDGRALLTGYLQSKWVADKLVQGAGSRGLRTLIYRPTFIAAPRTSDVVTALIRGSLEVGRFPRLELKLDTVAVDSVAAEIVRLALLGVWGERYTLASGRGSTVAEIFSDLRAYKIALEPEPFEAWQRRFRSHLEKTPQSPLFGVLPLLDVGPGGRTRLARLIDQTGAMNFQPEAGVHVRAARPVDFLDPDVVAPAVTRRSEKVAP